MHKIGGFSKRTGVPVKTLRYYAEIELLVPEHVDEASGYRQYSAAQFERLNRILAYKDLGFSLAEIRTLVCDDVSLEQVHALLRTRRQRLAADAEQACSRLERASACLELFERAGSTAACEIAVRDASSLLVASVRDTLGSHDESEQLFDELKVTTGKRGVNGRRGAIWHVCEPGKVDCEVFEVVDAPR